MANRVYSDELLNIYIDDGPNVDAYYSGGHIYSVGTTHIDYYDSGWIFTVGGVKFDYYDSGRIYKIGDQLY